MKIVLLERIEKLGRVGDVVTVSNGYGRNFLLPKRKALRATPENLEYFKNTEHEYVALNETKKAEAEKIAVKIQKVVLDMISPAQSTGVLYGSITMRDIATELAAKGFNIAKTQVVLSMPIKEVGEHTVRIDLHPEVVSNIKIYVASTADELEKLKRPVTEESQKAQYVETQDETATEETVLEAEPAIET